MKEWGKTVKKGVGKVKMEFLNETILQIAIRMADLKNTFVYRTIATELIAKIGEVRYLILV